MAQENTFRETLAKIKEAYDIVDLIQAENVSLTKKGEKYKGLCPFHSEKTPSFTVDETFQTYRCFGCGAHGDIFSFTEAIHGGSFMDAVLYLAKMKNIDVDFTSMGDDSRPSIDYRALYNLLQDSYDFYRAEFDKLPDSHPAKQEIIKRGLSTSNPVFAYAPERYGALQAYLSERGYSTELMEQSQLISKGDNGYYDFFHARLLITLSDFSGRPVSYSARKLFDTDKRAKYVNGKQSPVYEKQSVLFNLNEAKSYIRDKKEAIICEGPFDVLALDMAGIHNAVASCGTAFTEKQLRSLEQIVDVDGNLVFSFDGDDAGIQAAIKTFNHFPLAHGNSSVILFPEGLDPCDYLVKYGADRLTTVFDADNRVPIIDFVVSQLADKLALSDMMSRYKFARLSMGKYVPAVTDPVLRDYMIRRVSVVSGIQVDELLPMLGKEPRKQVERVEENKAVEGDSSEIVITNSTSDVGYTQALSMLIREPTLLYPELKGHRVPKKYQPFIKELAQNCRAYFQRHERPKIIPEQYNEPNFVKKLQAIQVSVDYNDTEKIKKQFNSILDIATASKIEEAKTQKRLAIEQALSQAKSQEEVIKLLKIASN